MTEFEHTDGVIISAEIEKFRKLITDFLENSLLAKSVNFEMSDAPYYSEILCMIVENIADTYTYEVVKSPRSSWYRVTVPALEGYFDSADGASTLQDAYDLTKCKVRACIHDCLQRGQSIPLQKRGA